MLIEPGLIVRDGSGLIVSDGADVPVFGGSVSTHETLRRVVFHELMHVVFAWERAPTDIQFEEELAVFAENVIYNRAATANGWSDSGVIRYGHDGSAAPTGGVSGINAFSIYNDVAIDFANSNGNQAVFSATDGTRTLTKTYFNFGVVVGSHSYDHYIHLEETTSGTPYVTANSSTLNVDVRSSLWGDMMGGSVGIIGANMAVAAWQAMNALTPGIAPIAITRIHGLGADSWGDGGFSFSGATNAGTGIHATVIEINDSYAQPSTLLIGAVGGISGGDILYAGAGNDIVVATGGNNEIHGGGGNDYIIGSSGNDHAYGDSGNDTFVASYGNDTLDGGTNINTAYYGNLLAGISFGSDGVTKPNSSGPNGTDTLVNIQRIVGTSYGDNFFALGTGMTLYGNGGNDTFIAANGADVFRAGPDHHIAGTVSFAGLTTFDNVITQYGTNLGHVYDRPDFIIGSAQRDIIQSGRAIVHAGGGDDEISNMQANVFGEAGNDIFRGPAVGFFTIDGGSGYDTIDLTDQFGPNIFINIDWRDQYHSVSYTNNGVSIQGATLFSIENFIFSPTGPGIRIILPDNVQNTFTGTSGANDTITGGYLNDTLRAGGAYLGVMGAHNIINGGGGNDTIYGATNGNSMYDGDLLDGGDGNDTIWGSASKDSIVGGIGGDYLHGGAGNDHFYDASGTNYIYGDAGGDILHLEGYHTSQLLFGSAGTGWRYVSAKDGSFIDYITSVEGIMTMDGGINVTYSSTAYRANTDHADDAFAKSNDADGFYFSGSDNIDIPDDLLIPESLSFTNDGVFNFAKIDISSMIYNVLNSNDIRLSSSDFEAFIGEAPAAFVNTFERNTIYGKIDTVGDYDFISMNYLMGHAQMPIQHDMLIL